MERTSSKSNTASRAAGAVQRKNAGGTAEFKDNRTKSAAQMAMDEATAGEVSQRAPEDDEKIGT